jgi:hypothetical protein
MMFLLSGYRFMELMTIYFFLVTTTVVVIVDGDDSGIELLSGGGRGFHGAFLM